jgi:hypothetical protein
VDIQKSNVFARFAKYQDIVFVIFDNEDLEGRFKTLHFGLFPVHKNHLRPKQHYCWLAKAKMRRSKIQKSRPLLMSL